MAITSFSTSHILGAAVLVPLVTFIASALWSQHRKRSEARRLGCQPAPCHRSKLPFGIDIIRGASRADKEFRTPEYFRQLLGGVRLSDGNPALTFSFTVAFTKGLFTADPVVVQALLSRQFQDFELGLGRRIILSPLLGDGIFTQDGEAWKHSRALLRPAFSRQQVSDLELEERHVQNLMQCLHVKSEDRPEDGPSDANGSWTDEVDLQTLFFRYTMDSSTEYLFGASADSQLRVLRRSEESRAGTATPTTQQQDDEIDFATSFDKAMDGMLTRSQYADLGQYIWPRGFWQACKECHAWVDKYVARQLAGGNIEHDHGGEADATATATTAEKKKYIFLDALAAETPDRVEMRFQLMNVLLAGRDTTAALMSFVFYLLARDPARFAKIRAAVLEAFGEYAPGSPPTDITFEALKGCRYLQHVLDETLRLLPIIPLNARRAVKDTTLPQGGGPDGKSKLFVPKGSMVVYSVYISHRRKDIWGEDSDEFVPERWEGRKTGWEYLPFNGGPRICPGQQFALTKAAYVVARLVQRFDRIENTDPEPVLKFKLVAALSSGTGVRVRLHQAAASRD